MNRTLHRFLCLFLLGIIVVVAGSGLQAQTPITDGFVLQFTTVRDGQEAVVPIQNQVGALYNYSVDWGDGTTVTQQTTDAKHTYANAGVYDVTIKGMFPAIHFNSTASSPSNDSLLTAVLSWGNGSWQGMDAAFMGCVNLTSVANDPGPDFEPGATLYCMFYGCKALNGDLDKWDLTNVRETSSMFYQAYNFNGNISTWDVSNVTNMQYMFFAATSFNSDISGWNVGRVEYMDNMFNTAARFNQDISGWDTHSLVYMSSMFQYASDFNQNLNGWDVSHVKNLDFVFSAASSFNKNLNSWDVAGVTSFVGTFSQATRFNGDISHWMVGAATTMQEMFTQAYSFNQDIGNWDVSSVTNMSGMFLEAYRFNQDIGRWKVAAVTQMDGMFMNDSAFNQNLSGWDISKVTNMQVMLDGTKMSPANYEATLNGWALLSVSSGVALGANGLRYCDTTGHSALATNSGWTFNGDRMTCFVAAVPDVNGIVYVDSTAAVNGDGSSWTKALRFLSNATESANINNGIRQIHIAKGSYYPTGYQQYVYIDSVFSITRSDLRLLGGYPNGGGPRDAVLHPTVLSGELGNPDSLSDNSATVLSLSKIPKTDSLIVDGLTVTRGAHSAPAFGSNALRIGSAISIVSAFQNAVIRNCNIVDNYSYSCSGISVTVAPEDIPGGDLNNVDNSLLPNPQILNCLFAHNVVREAATDLLSMSGGVLFSLVASPYVANCSFIENKGVVGGCLGNLFFAQPIIDRCVFSGNEAAVPVAIAALGASPKLVNCVIRDNVSIGYVSQEPQSDPLNNKINNAIIASMQASHPSLINCTVVNNKSSVSPATGGGLIYNMAGSSANITNCIFWGNTNSGIVDDQAQEASSVAYSLLQGRAADTIRHLLDGMGSPSIFTDTANGDYTLVAGSPVIDAGLNDSLTTVLAAHLGGSTSGGMDLASSQRIENGVIDLGAFELNGSGLPVKSSDLTGLINKKGRVTLHWKTFTESGNKGFYMQRSMDGVQFESLGFVPTQASNGISSTALDYYYDAGLLNGVGYYRLIQEDQYGTRTTSNTVRLASHSDGFKLLAYPNPVHNQLRIRIDGEKAANASLLLLDLKGRVIQRVKVAVGSQETVIDMQGLASGIYIVQYADDKTKKVIKVVKQ